MDRSQYEREKEEFSAWAASNEHNMMSSFPKSGRNYLGNLIRQLSGQIVIPGIKPLEVTVGLDDVFLFMAHMPRWEIRGDKGRYILLIRDPRDAILSRAYTQSIETSEPVEQRIATDSWLLENIRNWRRYFDVFEPHPRLRIVQYELLCLEPVWVLQHILDYLGVEPILDIEEVVAAQDLTKPDPLQHHGFVRCEYGSGTDRYNDHCLKWQRDPLVTESYLGLIWREAAGVMVQYGYTQRGQSISCLTRNCTTFT